MSNYAVDAYGRPYPTQPYYGNNNVYAYRDELRKRLEELERRYPEQPPQQPPPPPSAPPSNIMRVTTEKDAQNYPLDYNNPGAVMIFVKEDESTIYAKRLNTSTGGVDFRVYELVKGDNTVESGKESFDFTTFLPLIGTVTSQIDSISSGINELKELMSRDKSASASTDGAGMGIKETSRSKGNSRSSVSNGETGEPA